MPVEKASFTPLSVPALIVAAALSLGVAHAQDASDSTIPDDARATVNGRPISELSIGNVAEQITASGQQADEDRILDELINLEVLTQAAEELGLDETPEVAASLQLQYTQTMANAYLARQGADMSFSEEELRAEYDAQSANVDRAEYRASHILLETEEDAQQMIADLAAGTSFETLAKEHSIDPAGENGGDLGWFQATTMVPEFTAAVAEMEVGDTSTAPVASEFGYHVIKLVDRRDAALPDFDSVKSGLSNLAVRKALAQHVEELRAAAKVEIRE
ncbi:peptidylprolyl isomerase [Granulosicoccus sp. 3-233]|uniref:peptidylprolyl isomerase n=1 Tax=Granulosicoccus sp. 3-233 TaxID=3417969 RepID=UPI003D328D57